MICPKGYDEQSPKADKLVKENMQMVKRLAWHFQGRAGRFVELDDLMQAGYLGLVDASRIFRPRRRDICDLCRHSRARIHHRHPTA